MPDGKKMSIEFLFSDANTLYSEFKKVIYEMTYAITLPCAGNEEIFGKMTAIINFKIFEKIEIKDLVLVLSKEELNKITNALRAILERMGYYKENS